MVGVAPSYEIASDDAEVDRLESSGKFYREALNSLPPWQNS